MYIKCTNLSYGFFLAIVMLGEFGEILPPNRRNLGLTLWQYLSRKRKREGKKGAQEEEDLVLVASAVRLVSPLLKMVSVESTVETGHDDMIHDAQMDYYGTRLATCSSDK